MSISPGFTDAEIREFVMKYHMLPHGQKEDWLREQPFSRHRFRRWRDAVFAGDLDRGLIPRERGDMTDSPGGRNLTGQALAAERKRHAAEMEQAQRRVRELEEANELLGKAIGLLHAMNVQEPGPSPKKNARPGS